MTKQQTLTKLFIVLSTAMLLAVGLSRSAPEVQAQAFSCANVTEIPQAECEDLVTLYNSTDGPNWWRTNTGWLTTNTPCSWHGVTCEGGHVTRLTLWSIGLSGSIPDFSNLPNLTHLQLAGNSLNGSIPDFSNLPNLTNLELSSNELNGSIPDFSNLPNLTILHLGGDTSDNRLSGSIPNFSNLPNLTGLHLANNQFDGSIPDFSNLPNLTILNLGGNQLSGPIPNFSNLPNLISLYLYDNNLNSVPDFTNLPNLEQIYLDNNNLSNVPDFSNLPNLIELYLYGNNLSGPIPDFNNLPNLWSLSLGDNPLNGPIPDFKNLPNLRDLYIDDINLNGPLPDFSNLPKLTSLSLENNQFSGPLLDFSNLPKLTRLYLDGNQLSGPIHDFKNLPNLKTLRLDNNQLSGSIPDFSNLPNLELLFLDNNLLSGPVPDLNWETFYNFTLNNNCGLVALNDSQAAVLSSKDPDWQLRDPDCDFALRPIIQLSSSNLEFGNQRLNTSSLAQVVTLQNTGLSELSISSITTNGNFAQTNNCGSTIASNGSCTLNVTFTPSRTGSHIALLTINSNAYSNPDIVGLSGTGVQPLIASSPTGLTFGMPSGGPTPAGQSLTINNSGSGSFTWTVTDDTAWLAVTPLTGQDGEAVTVSITNTATLGIDTYTGTITISSSEAANSPQTVPVTLTIASEPILMVQPTDLNFETDVGNNPTSQAISITNVGTGTISWTASTTATWLTLSQNNGSAPAQVTISVDVSNLTAGSYHETITIDDGSAKNSIQTIPINLIVNETPQLQPDLTVIPFVDSPVCVKQTTNFTATVTNRGQTEAMAHNLALYDNEILFETLAVPPITAGGSLSISHRLTPTLVGNQILKIIVDSTSIVTESDETNNTATISLLVQADDILPTGSLSINAGADSTDTASVTLTLAASDTGLCASDALEMRLSNDGTTWDIWQPYTPTATWTLPNKVGRHTVYVRFRDETGNVSSNYSDSIILLLPQPVLAVSPASISFTMPQGETDSATLQISNTGTGVLTWTAQTDPTWLTVSPSGGTAPANLNVTVNPTTLTAGSYTAGLTISSNGGGATIPVSVMVESNVTYSVTGQISNSLGSGVDGVVISLGRYTTTSDNAGQFSLSVPDGDYTVVISKTGYSFSGQPATVSIAGVEQALPEIIGLYTAPSVDSGFRPDPNGFKFNNFGFEDQSWQLFKQTFIDDLARIEHSNGTPKLAARAFYTATAGYWNIGRGGNCTGFANASLINFSKLNELETSEDDALNWSSEVVVYEVDGGEKKDVEPGDSTVKDYLHIYQGRQISQEHSKWWNQQGVGKTYQHYDYTPLDTLQLVKDALADFEDNPVTLAVRVSDIPCDRDKDGEKNETCTYGHRVVPYRVQRVNNNEHRIFVYDSNRPGAESYYISVFDDNSWQYDDGFSDNASRADWPTGIWQGDGELLHVKSVRANFPAHLPNYYTNLSSRQQVIDQQANLSPTLTVFPAGPVELLFSTAAGQQFGLQNGQRVTDLPGAFFSTVEAYNPDYPDLESPTIYHLPANLSYTLQAVGSGAYSMTVLGNNLALQLSGLTSTSQISLSADLRQLELATPNEQAYCYLLADDTLDQTSRAFDLCATSAGTTVISVTQDSGQLQLDNAGQATGYRLTVEQTGDSTDRQTLEGQTGADGSLTVEQAEDSTWVVDKPQQPTYLPLIVK